LIHTCYLYSSFFYKST